MSSGKSRLRAILALGDCPTPASIHLVIVVVALAAYLPLLFDPNLASLPAGSLALLLSLGAAYLLAGTYGWCLVDRVGAPGGYALYFVVQIAIALAGSYLSLALPVGGFLWLLILPVTAQSLALPRVGTAAVCALALGGLTLILARFGGWAGALQSLVSISAGVVFVLVFTQIALREQAAREEIERLAAELRLANHRLREYAVQVEELAITRERNRLAREIHDSLGHYLTVINVQLGAAQAVLDADRAKAVDALQKAQRLVQEGLEDVRRSVAALREAPTVNRPLPEAIGALVEEAEAAGIVTQLKVRGDPRPLGPRASLTLYRAAQEGLTNARKHAHPSRIDLTLDYRDRREVCLTVVDNGVGAADAGDGFGLLGLRERVELLGGTVHVQTRPGEGFSLDVRVPAADEGPEEA